MSPTPDKFAVWCESSQHVAAWPAGGGTAQRLGHLPYALWARLNQARKFASGRVQILEPLPTILAGAPSECQQRIDPHVA